MGNTARGGWWIEVAMSIAVLAVTAALAVPGFADGRIRANEQAAIDTLRQVERAQRALRRLGGIDCDHDGRSEFGFFGELSGRMPLRTDQVGGVGTGVLQPPVLPATFGRVSGSTVATRGYLFAVYLPDVLARAVPEAVAGGAAGSSICADQAERFWCAYAWPMAYGSSGEATFFLSERGLLLRNTNRWTRYSGTTTMPYPTAAVRSGTTGSMDCPIALDTVGHDGCAWRRVF